MEYRQLGRTGLNVSAAAIGSMNFGGSTDQPAAQALIGRALDAGVNFVDTANIYNPGASERIVGEALATDRRRDRVVLSTKVHVEMDPTDPLSGGNHRRHIIEQCDASLRRLGTDWIEVYFIHRPSTQVPIDETLRALDDLIRAGKSLHRHQQRRDMADRRVVVGVKEYGLNRFTVDQSLCHLLDRPMNANCSPPPRPTASVSRSGRRSQAACSPVSTTATATRLLRDSPSTPTARGAASTSPTQRSPSVAEVGAVAEQLVVVPVQVAPAWGSDLPWRVQRCDRGEQRRTTRRATRRARHQP